MSIKTVSLFVVLRITDLGIHNNSPKYPQYGVYVKITETYNRYSMSNPVGVDELCAAGCFYESPKDKVRCFWCDGA